VCSSDLFSDPRQWAQQDTRVRHVGVLMGFAEADAEGQARFQTFRQGLADPAARIGSCAFAGDLATVPRCVFNALL
jgi:hypothetical protein